MRRFVQWRLMSVYIRVYMPAKGYIYMYQIIWKMTAPIQHHDSMCFWHCWVEHIISLQVPLASLASEREVVCKGLNGCRFFVSSREGMPKGTGSQPNELTLDAPIPGITPHWEIRPYGAVSERHPLHGWIMHNHATLLLPVTCDLRSVVRKVGRSSNSSMPSICFFFVHCMFLSFFDRCHGSTCLWWCGHGKESFRLRHLCNLADIEINRLSEPDSMVPPVPSFRLPRGCLSICPHCRSKWRASRRCLGWSL